MEILIVVLIENKLGIWNKLFNFFVFTEIKVKIFSFGLFFLGSGSF